MKPPPRRWILASPALLTLAGWLLWPALFPPHEGEPILGRWEHVEPGAVTTLEFFGSGEVRSTTKIPSDTWEDRMDGFSRIQDDLYEVRYRMRSHSAGLREGLQELAGLRVDGEYIQPGEVHLMRDFLILDVDGYQRVFRRVAGQVAVLEGVSGTR